MVSKQMRRFLLLFWYLSQIPGIAFTFQDTTVTIHASQMNFSKQVDIVGDHVVLWGIATGENTWISYSISAISLSSFSLEVEAGADTAAGRWPKVGIAFNSPDNILNEFQVQSLSTTTFMHLGQFTPSDNDTTIYFVFTNDYWDPNKGHDVNLKLRNLKFSGTQTPVQPTKIDTMQADSITVSWKPNTEADLAGYIVYYGIASGSYSDNVDLGNITSHVLKLPADQTYYLAVKAYDQSKNKSGYSDEVVFYLNSEAQVTQIDTFKVNGDSLTVSWDPNTEADLAGYKIYYGLTSRAYFDSLHVGLETSRVLNLIPDKTYFLAVRAYDQTGNLSDYSTEVVFYLETSPIQSLNCDITEDGLIDLNDWLAFNASLDSKEGEPRFRKNADFNKDGKIDNVDQEIANTTCMNPWSGITNN